MLLAIRGYMLVKIIQVIMKYEKPSETDRNGENQLNEVQRSLAQRNAEFQRLIDSLDHTNTVNSIRALRFFVEFNTAINMTPNEFQDMDVDDEWFIDRSTAIEQSPSFAIRGMYATRLNTAA